MPFECNGSLESENEVGLNLPGGRVQAAFTMRGEASRCRVGKDT